MGETVDLRDFKKESFKRKVKDAFASFKKKVDAAVAWGMEHPAEAIAIVTLTAGTIKKVSGASQSIAENRRRNLDLYDPRTGTHSIMKRTPTPEERMIIDQRYARGESYVHILYDMRLLK